MTTAKGRKEVRHGGGINGFATEILRYPDEDLCVIVLCNVLPATPGRMADELAAIALGEPREPARKAAAINSKGKSESS